MTASYPIPAGAARAEISVHGSRFIADAGPAATVAAARAAIGAARAAMPDASHHCYAYLVGYGASLTAGMGDDGEPGGTAGRPMLAVLRGADLGDVVLVVTRYFGGTLLGTGGLVRAYSDAARAVLASLPRAQRIAMRRVVVRLPYADYAAARRALEGLGAQILGEEFSAEVALTADLPSAQHAAAAALIGELSAGRATITDAAAML